MINKNSPPVLSLTKCNLCYNSYSLRYLAGASCKKNNDKLQACATVEKTVKVGAKTEIFGILTDNVVIL